MSEYQVGDIVSVLIYRWREKAIITKITPWPNDKSELFNAAVIFLSNGHMRIVTNHEIVKVKYTELERQFYRIKYGI